MRGENNQLLIKLYNNIITHPYNVDIIAKWLEMLEEDITNDYENNSGIDVDHIQLKEIVTILNILCIRNHLVDIQESNSFLVNSLIMKSLMETVGFGLRVLEDDIIELVSLDFIQKQREGIQPMSYNPKLYKIDKSTKKTFDLLLRCALKLEKKEGKKLRRLKASDNINKLAEKFLKNPTVDHKYIKTIYDVFNNNIAHAGLYSISFQAKLYNNTEHTKGIFDYKTLNLLATAICMVFNIVMRDRENSDGLEINGFDYKILNQINIKS